MPRRTTRPHLLECSKQIIDYQAQKIEEFRTKGLEPMLQEIIAPQMLLHIREICASKASHSIGGSRLELLIKNITDSPGHFICALEGTNQQDSIIAARECLTEMKRAVIKLLNTLLNDELQQIRRTVMIDNPADNSVTSTVIDFANWLDNPLAMITHLQEYCNRYEADKKSSRPLKKAWGLTIQAIQKIAYFWFPGCIDVLVDNVPQLREQYKAQQAERCRLTLELAGGDLLTSLPDSTEPLEQQLYDRDLGRGIAYSFSKYPEDGEESYGTTDTQGRPDDPFAGLEAYDWDAHGGAAKSAVQDEDHICAAQGSAVSHLVYSHTPADRLNPWGSDPGEEGEAAFAGLQQTVQGCGSGEAPKFYGTESAHPQAASLTQYDLNRLRANPWALNKEESAILGRAFEDYGDQQKFEAAFAGLQQTAQDSGKAVAQGGGACAGWNPFDAPSPTPAAEMGKGGCAGELSARQTAAAKELAERLADRNMRQAEIKGQEHAAGTPPSSDQSAGADQLAATGRRLFERATSGELDASKGKASEGKASEAQLPADLF